MVTDLSSHDMVVEPCAQWTKAFPPSATILGWIGAERFGLLEIGSPKP